MGRETSWYKVWGQFIEPSESDSTGTGDLSRGYSWKRLNFDHRLGDTIKAIDERLIDTFCGSFVEIFPGTAVPDPVLSAVSIFISKGGGLWRKRSLGDLGVRWVSTGTILLLSPTLPFADQIQGLGEEGVASWNWGSPCFCRHITGLLWWQFHPTHHHVLARMLTKSSKRL